MADIATATEHLALAFGQAGMQRMSARVWAAVLCTNRESVTAGELAGTLGVSAGAVSGALKTLLNAGLIERVPAPGSRREHYAFPEGAWVRMMSMRGPVIDAMQRAAQEGIEAAGPDSVAGRRLAEMHSFHSYLIRELPLLFKRWEEEWSGEGGRPGAEPDRG